MVNFERVRQQICCMITPLYYQNSSSKLINWKEIIKPGNQHFLMRLGMMETATSFCKYAIFVSKYERNLKKKGIHNKRKQSNYSDKEEEHKSEKN